MSKIVSYRGMMADGEIETIPLATNNGLTGYRIVKFRIMPEEPGILSTEAVVKIYKTPQTAATLKIDFSDNRLLAAGFFRSNASAAFATDEVVIFDSEIFNQDIHVTMQDTENNPMNYYIELEQMKLDLNEQTVATLKDIRNVGAE